MLTAVCMFSAISPAAVTYSETLRTLRYASRAKNIVSCPAVDEDHGGKPIAEPKAQVAGLQRLLKDARQVCRDKENSCLSMAFSCILVTAVLDWPDSSSVAVFHRTGGAASQSPTGRFSDGSLSVNDWAVFLLTSALAPRFQPQSQSHQTNGASVFYRYR